MFAGRSLSFVLRTRESLDPRRLNNLSLRTKLIVTALIVALVPLAIVSYVSYIGHRQALVNSANEALAGAAAQTAANLDGFIQANLDAVRTEALLPDLADFLQSPRDQRAAGAGLADDAGRMAVILYALSRRDQIYISSYGLLDAHGIDVVDTDTSEIGIDYSGRDYFRTPLASGLPHVTSVEFSDPGAQPFIYFSAPVRDTQARMVGVLRIRYNATILQKIVSDTRGLAGKGSYAVLVDENHLRLADGESSDLMFKTITPLDPARQADLKAGGRLPQAAAAQLSTHSPEFEQGLANARGQPFFRGELGEESTTPEAVAVASMSAEPWQVAFAQDEGVFLAPVFQQGFNSLLIGAIMALLAFVTAAVGAQLLTAPIVRLTSAAQQVGAGNLNAQARVEAEDEIGALATTFNRMTGQLRQTLDGLAERGEQLRLANDRLQAELVERKRGETALRASEAKYRDLVNEVNDGFYVSDPEGVLSFANRALAQILGVERPEELVGRKFLEFVPPEQVAALTERYQLAMAGEAGSRLLVTEVVRQGGANAFIEIKPAVIVEGGQAVGNRGVVRDITERRKSEDEIQRRLAELEAVNRVSTAMRPAQTLKDLLPVVLDVTLEVMHTNVGSIWLYDHAKDQVRIAVMRGMGQVNGRADYPPERPGEGLSGYVFATQQAVVEPNFHMSPPLPESVRERIPPGNGGATIPLRAGNSVIGTLHVGTALPRELNRDEVLLLTILGEIAGNAIQRAKLDEETDRRLEHLTALGVIDRAITSSFDLTLSLHTVILQAIKQLGVDAADVLLFNPAWQRLKYVVGSGFRGRAFEHAQLGLGEGYAGRAILERRVVHIPNLTVLQDNPRLARAAASEDFVVYYGVPLIAKGQIKGVLEVYHRTPLHPDEEWVDFLKALAGQAAIAIDNATLFEGLERSNTELALAYDATIEGWSRALDLRDRETEGHTQRVTETTVRLARSFGINDADLQQIRWGALLHDIGKMGLPDSILLKPGPLTDEEWVEMRKHPTLAHEMLSPIRYLRSALEIPYCHHEKWDGSGYPRGLKGEEIPHAARLFAIVDVWDALRSDRPYRTAWPDEKVREYIRGLAGTHFDPGVLDAFFRLIRD